MPIVHYPSMKYHLPRSADEIQMVKGYYRKLGPSPKSKLFSACRYPKHPMDKQDNHQTAEACGLLHPEFEVGRFLLLVIEILSPSNSKTQIREYAALCLANGCEEFWAVDNTKKSVTVTNRNGRSIEYSAGMEVPTPLLGATGVAVDVIFG